MKYFTRNWYDRIQESAQTWYPSDQQTNDPEFERLSYPALKAYARYYESIKSTIDPSVRQLMELGLHDVLVENAERGADVVGLFLRFFWDRRRQSRAINISFCGVTATLGIESCVGDEIINT